MLAARLTEERYAPYVFILPCVVVLALLALYPFFALLYYSLHSWNLARTWEGQIFVGLRNYVDILTSSRFWDSLWVTVLFTAGSLGLGLASGLLLATVLNRPLRGRQLFLSVFILPVFLPTVIVGLMWRFLLNPTYGVYNWLLTLIGFPHRAWTDDVATALPTLVLIDTWQWLPFVTLLLFAGLQGLPRKPFEAAAVDGARPWQVFRYITLPLLRPVFLAVLLVRGIDVIRAFDLIYVVTMGGPGRATETVNFLAYKTAFFFFHVGTASAIAALLLGVIILFANLVLYLFGREATA